MPPPKAAVLPLNVQFVTIGLLLPTPLPMPPPASAAMLPLNVQFVTIGLESKMLPIPPASFVALLLRKVHPVMTGLLLVELPIPPAKVAEFALKVQLVTVGLPVRFRMPAPRSSGKGPLALPAVTKNPSSTAVPSVPLPITTW